VKSKKCCRCKKNKSINKFDVYRGHENSSCSQCLVEHKSIMEVRRKTPKYKKWYKQYRTKNRNRGLVYERNYKLKLKNEMLGAYGRKCVCCGEAETRFLTLDHRFNDGSQHRKELSENGTKIKTSTMYAYLRKLGWPKDRYQLLCWNCNCAKHIYKVCPHKEKA